MLSILACAPRAHAEMQEQDRRQADRVAIRALCAARTTERASRMIGASDNTASAIRVSITARGARDRDSAAEALPVDAVAAQLLVEVPLAQAGALRRAA